MSRLLLLLLSVLATLTYSVESNEGPVKVNCLLQARNMSQGPLFEELEDYAPNHSLAAGPALAQKGHIYVLNVNGDTERLDCVMKQVSNAPYSVTRMEAVTLNTLYTACPNLNWRNATMDRSKAMAILCSHYKILEKAMVDQSETEFLIVLEDDAIILSKATFWQKLEHLLHSDCQDYDYISVDTYDSSSQGRVLSTSPTDLTFCQGELTNSSLFPLKGQGTHMQIFRVSALRKILHLVGKMEHLLPADAIFASFEQSEIRARAWTVGMVKQFGKMGTSDEERQLSGCKLGVANSVHLENTILAQTSASRIQ